MADEELLMARMIIVAAAEVDREVDVGLLSLLQMSVDVKLGF